jgi:hypothetical protein
MASAQEVVARVNDKGEKSLIDHAGFKCPAWGDIDFNNKKIKEGGVCIMTDLDGDRAYAAFQGTGMPSQTCDGSADAGAPWACAGASRPT